MASGTGLLDGRTLRWDAPLLRRVGLKTAQLNPLSDEPATVSAARAKEFPELADVPLVPRPSATVRPAISAPARSRPVSRRSTSAPARRFGSSSPAGAGAKGMLAPFGLFAYRVDAQRRLVGGAVSNAGNLRAWALRELKLPENPAEQEKLLADRTMPAHGLTLLPFWIAERAPTWPEEIPSAVVGITQATGALDLLQGVAGSDVSSPGANRRGRRKSRGASAYLYRLG